MCIVPPIFIIEVWGKLVCQLFFGGKWLMASGLGGFWRGEGVDNSGQWSMVRILTSKGVLPGVKTPNSMGGGLPRLKPGPISEAKANAGLLPLHFVQGQDDGQKTSKGRFLRQAQDRLFDCASRDETARSSAQDDGKRDKGKGGGFRRKVRAAVAVRTSSGSFDSVTHDETVSHSAQDDSFFVLRQE